MFRRRAKGRRRADHHTSREQELARDIDRLRDDIGRLERALSNVIEASDDVIADLQITEAELETLRTQQPRSTGFARAWSSHTPAAGAPAGASFFDVGQEDQRARNWLLAPK